MMIVQNLYVYLVTHKNIKHISSLDFTDTISVATILKSMMCFILPDPDPISIDKSPEI